MLCHGSSSSKNRPEIMLTFDYKYVYYDIRLNNYAPILWDDVVFCDCYLG